ncbi:MAG: recombinase family protein [Gemmobacter sp.]|nr:recombinase family protein [Gemmobacter sp.]
MGYIRLSTEKQAADDQNFEKQAQRIRKACERRGLTLLTICEDEASGADPLGSVRREGLIDAVSRARYERAVLVIPEPTRLFRNVEAARDFLAQLDVPVFSVREGRFLKAPALLRAIARGEAAVHAIRQGTVEALARKKAEGIEFSNAEVRKKAAKISAKVRTQKSDSIALRVASVLQSDPAYRDLSNRALADLLNRQRILTGWRRPWTQNSVRDMRKKAMELIEMMDEVDNMEDDLDIVLDQATEAVSADIVPVSLLDSAGKDEALPVTSAENSDHAEEDDEMAQLRKLPGFGVF